MGEILGKLFVDPTALPGGVNCVMGNHTVPDPLDCNATGYGFVQVLFLLVSYGYVLFLASNLISDGSELLLLVPSLRGIVGSVVLPILGAVPDGAIVLFSGLGKDAANQVSVGVGALAGSTIMLLTLPWFLAVLGGRVDLDSRHNPIYRKGGKDSKLTVKGCSGFLKSGVAVSQEIKMTAKIMLATALVYFVIQGPAFAYEKDDPAAQARKEKDFSLAGMVLALVAFIAYLIYQVFFANIDAAVDKATRDALSKQLISFSGVFAAELQRAASNQDTESSSLIPASARFRDTLARFFNKYDINKDGTIDSHELKLLLRDMNENVTNAELETLMKHMDKDNNGSIDFKEFAEAMQQFILESTQRITLSSNDTSLNRSKSSESIQSGAATDLDEEDSDEEEEEIPEDFQDMSPKKQQRAIKFRAAWMMTLGTVLVLLFSDPMVDVLDDIGTRMNLPAFYVAFVLAPMASNASELIAAYNYAAKKTRKTIGISLSTLEGAAIMNNTFCLGIFLIIIYIQSLAWTFSAETISILLIQVLMFGMVLKKTHTLLDGCIIMSFYPLSIAIVAILENVAGLD